MFIERVIHSFGWIMPVLSDSLLTNWLSYGWPLTTRLPVNWVVFLRDESWRIESNRLSLLTFLSSLIARTVWLSLSRVDTCWNKSWRLGQVINNFVVLTFISFTSGKHFNCGFPLPVRFATRFPAESSRFCLLTTRVDVGVLDMSVPYVYTATPHDVDMINVETLLEL